MHGRGIETYIGYGVDIYMGDEQRSITSLKTTAKEWARKVGIDSIDRLNEMIDSGKGLELILVCEAMQSNCMYEIARKVSEQKRRIILISGPSSAGKTTLSHRLSIQLRAMGLRPHAIAADNYFVNREDNPKDENGNYKFEGRFNQGVVSLNLPQIGILARGDMDKFWSLLEERLDLCYQSEGISWGPSQNR